MYRWRQKRLLFIAACLHAYIIAPGTRRLRSCLLLSIKSHCSNRAQITPCNVRTNLRHVERRRAVWRAAADQASAARAVQAPAGILAQPAC